MIAPIQAATNMLNGKQVYIGVPYKVAHQQLSSSVCVSIDFRRDFDAWLGDIFGCRTIETVKDGQVFSVEGGLIMNQATFNKLSKAINEAC